MILNIPERKIEREKEKIVAKCETCSSINTNIAELCGRCKKKILLISRFAESNIPIKYWFLSMDDFIGDPVLLKKYKEISDNMKSIYDDGICICFAGSHGVGKTMAISNILKRVVGAGFSALYVTMNDIIANLLYNTSMDKLAFRNELLLVDFLAIDEFDPRYMGSKDASDLFGRNIEDIFRNRVQNNLPIFMSTNSPNVTKSFEGSVGQSISSLMNYAEIIPVLGKDRRKEGK